MTTTANMTAVSDETFRMLESKHNEIMRLREQIKSLETEMDGLVPRKLNFSECKAMKCKHTYKCKQWCKHHDDCIRSRWSHGAYVDYFKKQQPTVAEQVGYPTLGWKKVSIGGLYWDNEWHEPFNVVKETERTLVLDDGTILLKSTLHKIEDCQYISSRSGGAYFCADTDEIRDASSMLLKVQEDENIALWQYELNHLTAPDCEQGNTNGNN